MRMVMVTGGSRGIGRAIAEKCLEAGFEVHLVANQEVPLSRTAEELSAKGIVSHSAVDLSNRRQVESFAQGWSRNIYGLVNNAGYWKEDSLTHLDVDMFGRMMDVNVMAPYMLTKGLYEQIETHGRIVNIASQLGTQGRERMGAYAATKHALVGLTRCWAPEASRKNVTVNAVCPGWVDTESNRVELRELGRSRGTTLEEVGAQISQGLVLRRFIKQEEVASLVAFLLSSDASGISGQVYEIK